MQPPVVPHEKFVLRCIGINHDSGAHLPLICTAISMVLLLPALRQRLATVLGRPVSLLESGMLLFCPVRNDGCKHGDNQKNNIKKKGLVRSLSYVIEIRADRIDEFHNRRNCRIELTFIKLMSTAKTQCVQFSVQCR